MSQPDSVKVEIDLPANVLKAASMVCTEFDYDFNELCVRAIIGDLEAAAGNHFEDYTHPEDVPVMVDPKTAVYLKWWYSVAAARRTGLSLDDFLMDAGREYMEFIKGQKKKITEEEMQSLAIMRAEIGAEERKAFAEEITELLREKP